MKAKSKYPRGTKFTCLRCDGSWRSIEDSEDKPRACSKCKSAYWDKPRQMVPHASRGRGRRPQ